MKPTPGEESIYYSSIKANLESLTIMGRKLHAQDILSREFMPLFLQKRMSPFHTEGDRCRQ
jgi:hypothetical protein